MSSRRIEAAKKSVEVDPAGAYALAYDSARKASTVVLARQGLPPTSCGGHIAVVVNRRVFAVLTLLRG